MKARKVLYVDYYSFIGGGQVNLLSVFKALDRRRFQPLLALPKEGPFADRARELKVPVFILPMGKARWRFFWQAWPAMLRLRRVMREQGVALVHANCYPAAKLAGPAARGLGIPCLWHKQIAVTQKPGSTTGRLWRHYSRYCGRVLAVSRQGMQGLKALGIAPSKLRLLYNNADTDRLAGAKPKKGLPKPLVLAAGMRRPHKGFDDLLQAIPLVKAKAHFYLLGDPTPAEAAHEAMLKRLESHPKLKGRLKSLPSQPDLAPWLKAADVFVSSSRWEGSPLSVIEAMAAGRAIVATRQGSGEILAHGRTAWLCDSGDSEGLAKAVDAALASKAERRKRGLAAQAAARREFALKGYVKKLGAIYDEMLAERK